MGTLMQEMDTRIGRSVVELDTPALVVDLALMGRNIARIAGRCRENGVNWRPHIKGMKVPSLARACLDAGAIGVTSPKVGDAEWMAEAGVDHILIANEVIGAQKLDRVCRIRQSREIILSVDSVDGVNQAGAAARRAGVDLGVVIEVDGGMSRCGTAPGEPTLALARRVTSTPGLVMEGVMGWEGQTLSIADLAAREPKIRESVALLTGTADLLRSSGIPVRIVSAGGTGTYIFTTALPGITEVQAGGGVLGDRTYARWGAPVEFALTLLVTVVSRPTPTRIVVDAGRKAISPDLTMPWPKGYDEGQVVSQAYHAEHGLITLKEPTETPRVGDKIELIAGYGDWTVCLHDEIFAVRDGLVAEVWPVAPRSAYR